MNLCAFSRPNIFGHKMDKHIQLERLLAQFYLPSAKLEFNSQDASNDWLTVGVTSAQGWRTQQEDAHVFDLRFDNQGHLALFGVFDGHNGCEISQYAAKILPEYIKKNEHFAQEQYGIGSALFSTGFPL